jgi:hypothetical protein
MHLGKKDFYDFVNYSHSYNMPTPADLRLFVGFACLREFKRWVETSDR